MPSRRAGKARVSWRPPRACGRSIYPSLNSTRSIASRGSAKQLLSTRRGAPPRPLYLPRARVGVGRLSGKRAPPQRAAAADGRAREFESAGFLSEAEHRARAEVTRAYFTPLDPVSSAEPADEATPSPSSAQPAAETMEEDDDAAADDDDGPMVMVNGQEKGDYLVTEEDQGFMSTDELVRLREVHDQLVGQMLLE